MNRDERLEISNIPEISAIYYGLLQNGYDYFSLGRDDRHVSAIKGFAKTGLQSPFFADARQDTCQVYPFWPRAAMLETAVFYLNADLSGFSSPEDYRRQVMSAGNLSAEERDSRFWDWVADFPCELKRVLSCDGFKKFLDWENNWILAQNAAHREELAMLKACIAFCGENYRSPVTNVRVVLSSVKCVCSADYHMVRDQFIFSSGAFSAESVVHEFLHHVVHPAVTRNKAGIISGRRQSWNIDPSYYLSGDEGGILNSFEEYLVRLLTEKVLDGTLPTDLDAYIDSILKPENEGKGYGTATDDIYEV